MRLILLFFISLFYHTASGQDFSDMLGKDEKTIRKYAKQEELKFSKQENTMQEKVLKFRDKYFPSEYTFYIDKDLGTCKVASLMSLDERLMEKMYSTIKENFEKVADKEYRTGGVRYVLIPPMGYFVKREADMKN